MKPILQSPAAVVIAAFSATALSTAATAQTMYRWVDKDGRVHYSQQPPPRDAAKKVEQKRLGSAPEPAKGAVAGQVPFALQRALSNFPVILYTSPGCKSGCPEARELLKKRGVPFREVSVTDDAGNAVLKRETGDNKVPAVTIGRSRQVGFEEGAWNSELDTAGYPRTPIATGPLPTPPEPEGLKKPEREGQPGQAEGQNQPAAETPPAQDSAAVPPVGR